MDIKEFADHVFQKHPARFTRKEKESFFDSAKQFLYENGVGEDEVKVVKFKGAMKSQNLVIGDPSAEYVFTAHYDTPGKTGWMLCTSPIFGQTGANIFMLLAIFLLVPILHIAVDQLFGTDNFISFLAYELCLLVIMFGTMFIKNKNNRNDNTSGSLAVLNLAVMAQQDPEFKSKCCFVLFDNEEWGLIGSAGHAKWLKKNKIDASKSTYINLDCIGYGDVLLAAKTPGKNTAFAPITEHLSSAGLNVKKKTSSMVFISDHANFKNSVMLSYVKRSLIGPLYMPKIHTARDKICEMDKVTELCASLKDYTTRA